MATDSVADSIVINADPASVYNVVGDFESYPAWIEEFKEAQVLSTRDDGWADQVRYTISAVGFTIGWTLAYSYEDDRVSWSLVEGDMLRSLDGSYDMVDNGDETTTLTYSLAVDSTVPVPGLIRRQVAKKVISDFLKVAKEQAEQAAEAA